MIPFLLFVVTCALMNRARGSRFFDLLTSTVQGRVLSMLWIAGTLPLTNVDGIENALYCQAWAFFSLMLWCTPGWNKYWSAQIGNEPNRSKLWGTACMAIRMCLFMPVTLGLSYISGNPENMIYSIFAPVMALPYVITGAFDKHKAIPLSELINGAIMGYLINLSVS